MSDRVVVRFLDPISCLAATIRRMIRLIAQLGRRSPGQLSVTFHHSYATPGKILHPAQRSSFIPEHKTLGILNMSTKEKTTPQTSGPDCRDGEEPKVSRPPAVPSRSGASSSFSKFLPHGWVQRAAGGDFKFKDKGGGEGRKGRKSPSKTQRQGGHTGHKGDSGDRGTGNHGNPGGGYAHAEAPQNKRARVNSSGDVQNKGQAAADHGPSSLSENGKKKQAHSQDSEDCTPTRDWYHTPTYSHHKRKPGSGVDFSVMSYNVLAQELLMANWYLYLDCADQEGLTWDVRKEKLLQQFQHYNVDVLCLQEVQESHYHDFFLPELKKLGYEGLYKKRTGDKPDGCATFYRTSKFILVKHRLVEYFRPGTDVLDRDNVAIVVLLKPKTGSKQKMHTNLCIANTHLLFNKRRGDVKLSQLGVLLAEVDQLAFDPKVRYWDAKVRCHPVVLCGDLNSAPFSPLYQFLNTGQLAYSGYERSEISGQSSPPRWRNWMQPPLWPPFVGITDHCQYHQAVLERRQPATLPNNVEKDVFVTSTAAHQSPSEDHVLSDSDAPTSSPLSVKSDAQSNPDDQPVKSDEEQGSHDASGKQPAVPADNFSTSETVVVAAEGGCQTSSSSTSDPTMAAPIPQVPPFSSCIFHPFNLRSVYSHFTVDHEREVTTHHGRANCTVDYIFYTARPSEGDYTGKGGRHRPKYRDGRLKLMSRLSLLSDRDLERMGSLPNKEHPSDHLPLIAKFRLTDK
ncbi:protein angel homolog 2-like isoform X2 [Branchiostoma floridae x Branchiostoma japonicum]